MNPRWRAGPASAADLFPLCAVRGAGQLKALERSLQARLDACCSQLAALGSVLAGITSDSKDPFAGESSS